MGLVKKVDHVAVIAKDLDESARFYTGLLGFEVKARMEIPQQHIKNALMSVPGDDFVVELVQFTDDREYYYGDGMFEVVALKVDDLYAARDELISKGVEFLMDEPVDPGDGGKFIFFRGPAGEKLELVEK
ncbi:MAG: VOC family protein [Clostridiales Family XIII bacterium]|jgi:lactoylglutathione lyase|nr:VOC family protein [Clostridiales Family XIII bacterium]